MGPDGRLVENLDHLELILLGGTIGYGILSQIQHSVEAFVSWPAFRILETQTITIECDVMWQPFDMIIYLLIFVHKPA
jgi:hypothetical protein